MASSADTVNVSMRFAMVVGEESGDILGAGLMRALQTFYPNAVFEGIGGPRMVRQGFISHFPQDRLAVMGLVEPLKRLPELLGIRRQLRARYINDPPSAFIGIDSPDFNLDLELGLRKHGIKTVHYVSPSVWAWRQGRLKKIAAAVDLMLALFPFEKQFYQGHKVPVCFVGHPLADDFPLEPDKDAARNSLQLNDWIGSRKVLALMPGSRASEVERLGLLFMQVAQYCLENRPDLCFLIPSANERRHLQLQRLLDTAPAGLPIRLVAGQSQQVMTASDAVLMASGTASLEAMLLKKPMVIAYKLAPLSFWLLRRLVRVPYIGLPNLLAGKELVPEFIQDDATVDAISRSLLTYFNQMNTTQALQDTFLAMHQQLRRNASVQAAQAIKSLLEGGHQCV